MESANRGEDFRAPAAGVSRFGISVETDGLMRQRQRAIARLGKSKVAPVSRMDATP
jgi:hypothetical protein